MANDADKTEGTPRLNLAGRMARYFIGSKVTVLIVLFALLAGLMALTITPREENPQIIVPAANVIVSKPGATPKEIEQLIVNPLQSILRGITGVEHIYGMAMDSQGVVTVQFKVGEDKVDSLVKLYDHLMSNLDRMPPGTRQPLVKPVDVDDVPILTVSLSSQQRDDMQLRRIANNVLEHLRRVEGSSVSFVHGGRARQINVNLDLARMRRYNVTLADMRRVLEATNVETPSGTLITRNTASAVHAGGVLRSAEDVRNLVVGLHRLNPVFLKDVADVVDGPGEIERLKRIGYGVAYTGERPLDYEIPAVTLAIAKKTGTNAVKVADSLLAELERVRPSLIPDDVKIDVTRNDGERANDAVNTLVEHLAIAIGTVVLLLVLFLGWRAAGIVTVTIPLILFITLAVGLATGQSINRITLFALILSLGLLVDDSIVVIENIVRHYARKGVDKARAAVDAVNEIGKPTNLATFTVILAFLPMLWVTGMMGPYMAPIPKNVPVAMITSLLIAYSVAPWAARRWLKTGGHGHDEHRPGLLERGYARLMRPLLASSGARWVFFFAIIGVLLAAMAFPAFDIVQGKMLPKNNTNTFNITIDLPEGSTLEQTDHVARRVGDIVRAHPEVTTYETSIGAPGVVDFNGLLRGSNAKEGPNVAEVRVNLRSKHERDASSIDVVLDMREPITRLAKEAGANIKLVEDPPGPPVRAAILAELYGPDYNQLRQIADALKREVFAKTDDVVDIDDSVPGDSTEYAIEVDRRKAMLAGIPPAEIAETLKAFLAGYDMGAIEVENEKEPVPIRFRIPAHERVPAGEGITTADLRGVYFTSPQGTPVPLSEIAQVRSYTAPKTIEHKDLRPVVYVTGELGIGSQVYAVLDMWNYLKKNPLPNGVQLNQYFMGDPDTLGYSLRWDGEMRLTLDVFRDLGIAFGVAIVLIYLILVAYYRSFIIPVIVMGAIPLTIIGVLPGHAIMGQYFTATSMIGVIALAGIVVRNSLLLIDFILDHRRAGHALNESVLQAGIMRLRPIMLTAFAIILGTLVMIVDPVFGGLAISLIFGTFASTVLSLFVIPIGYFNHALKQERKYGRETMPAGN